MKHLYLISLAALTLAATPVFAQTQEDTDAKFAAQDWQGAATDYQKLLAVDKDNGSNWFNLGSAFQQLEQHKPAIKAYQQAIETGYVRIPRARLRLAQMYMKVGMPEKALRQLEEIAKTGGPSGQIVKNIPDFAPLADNVRFEAAIAALTPCTDAEFRHFDFWIGGWDVTSGAATQPTASSKISGKHNGCVVLEEYVAGPFTGMSINFYDATRKTWHQSWMSNAGGSNYLEGGLTEEGAMQLSDENLPISKIAGTINRVTWTPNEDGSVRQFWQNSTDEGKTWTVSFDGLYTPKKPSEPERE